MKRLSFRSCRHALVVVFFLLLTLLSGCGTKTTVVLLNDPDGGTGAVTVSNEAGKVDIDTAHEATSISGRKSIPTTPVPISKEQIEAEFSTALEAEPKPPVHFILYFISDSNDLTVDSAKSIPAILQAISERKSMDISIVGHTDTVGSGQYNFTLSRKRAETIAALLVKRGAEKLHITTTSHGEGNPLIPTADNVSEPRNRRVEVVIR